MLGQKLKKGNRPGANRKNCAGIYGRNYRNSGKNTAQKRLYIWCQGKACQCGFPPVKTYGDYTFPAGKYRALQITLGKGEGHNWWCVLYPNMCFQGSVYEVMDESSGEELREVLTQEEYADVFDSGKNADPVEIP